MSCSTVTNVFIDVKRIAGGRGIQAPRDMSEISKRRSTNHVSRDIRPPRPTTCVTLGALRPRNHGIARLPMRFVLGQPSGFTTRSHNFQSDADLVPGFVRQSVEPVVHFDPEFAVPKTGDVLATVLELCQLCGHLHVLQIRGHCGHGDGT